MNETEIAVVTSFLKEKNSLLGLMEYPLWNYVTQVFNYTRAYDDALTFCHRIFEELETHKDEFSEDKYNRKMSSLYLFELLCLFKLDRWDDFMENWKNIFSNVKIANTYSKSVKYKPEIQEFILGESRDFIFVHFLWGIRSKKESIERKIRKRNAGGKIGNLLHDQQSSLTSEEILERLNWIVKFRSTGEYDFDPPASRQRQKQRMEREKTLDNKIEKES